MLGNHDGISPLEDVDLAFKPALRAMGRMKLGGDVVSRTKLLRRVLAQMKPDDRYWMEALASKLTETGSVEAIPAHVVALVAGFELARDDIARLVIQVNSERGDRFVQEALQGLMSAAPDFARRLKAERIHSDEPFIRVALAHLFRRDPRSSFQMFLIDGAARTLHKGLKLDIQSFVRECLEDIEAHPAPEGAWGYVMLLVSMVGRSGYFLYEPTDKLRAEMRSIRDQMSSMIDVSDDAAFANHLCGAAYSGHLKNGRPEHFAGMMSVAFETLGFRHGVLYVREDEGGVHTQIIEIPVETAEDARRAALGMPQVKMHDDFALLTEYFAQLEDLKSQKHDA
jgi:hypothetical protein